jgi:hypothetical protein
VVLAGFFGVVDRMGVMAMRDVRMVTGGLMVAFLVMLGGFPVMLCGFFGHGVLLLYLGIRLFVMGAKRQIEAKPWL